MTGLKVAALGVLAAVMCGIVYLYGAAALGPDASLPAVVIGLIAVVLALLWWWVKNLLFPKPSSGDDFPRSPNQ